jgi:hypothetical protein
MTKKTGKEIEIKRIDHGDYTGLLTGVSELLEQARHAAARSVNQILVCLVFGACKVSIYCLT